MSNPFELIDARLSTIEQILLSIQIGAKIGAVEPQMSGRKMNLKECSQYTGFAVQTLYRRTSNNEIPHSKQGGKLFFDRVLIDEWLLNHSVPTKSEISKAAGEYITDRARRPR
jgi:predicted DNA-binding transcriptional regulator AlpA